jgi:hypothetical protein
MIYQGQVITIVLETNTDLSGATTPRIRYEKDDKTDGEWVATINGNNLEYTTDNDDLDVAGTWKLQAYVDQSGNRYGNVARIQVDRRL